MKFKYQARTKEGELQAGFVEAGSRDMAVQILSSHDLFVLTVAYAKEKHWYDAISGFVNRVRRKELVIFARQLATLLDARLPLNNALVTLKEQTASATLKDAISQISQDVNSGLSFSQALERQGSIFPSYYTAMIRASEITGNLNEAATFLADYTEREGDLASKASSALIYPGILLSLFLVVGFVILIFVFPQIEPIFQESNVSLPWYTQGFLDAGTFFQKWWPAVILAVFFLITIVTDYFRSTEGKALWDQGEIGLPILKKVFLPLLMARFGNAMALLIHGGIPIAQSLEIMETMMDSAPYSEILRSVTEDVRQGQLLSESLARYPKDFPTLVSQMIGIGETTGKTEEMFSRVAGIYTREANKVMDNLTDLIQPVLLIGMGALTGLLFASILVPLYSLTASIHYIGFNMLYWHKGSKKHQMIMQKKQKGFTLIEILIVVAIIAILASVVLVGLGPTQRAGRDARRLSDLRELQNGLELFYNKCGYYPGSIDASGVCSAASNPTDWATLASALQGIGVTSLPNDPNANSSYGYFTYDNGDAYVLGAALEDPNNGAFVNYAAPVLPSGVTISWITDGASVAPNIDCISAPSSNAGGKTYCLSL